MPPPERRPSVGGPAGRGVRGECSPALDPIGFESRDVPETLYRLGRIAYETRTPAG